MIDLKRTILLAQACNAAYELDATARLTMLSFVGLVEDAYVIGANDSRALICHSIDGSMRGLFFQGTQFTKGEIPSIMENIKVWPIKVNGFDVDSGYWQQVASLTIALPPLDGLTDIAGHSMGGCIAHLYANTAKVPDGVTLTSFGAPKCAGAAFWAAAKHLPTRIVNQRDFAPVWPYLPDEWEQPGEQWWVHDGVCEPNLHRPVMPDSIPDHMPDKYIAALQACLPG